VKLAVVNGILVHADSERLEEAGLLISGGIIESFLKGAEVDALVRTQEVEILDAKGLLVFPGLIDMHVHLREPGQEYKETIRTGTMAAASGGFTGVACMPNTIPVNDHAAVTDYILRKSREKGFAEVYPVAAVTVGSQGKQLTEFGDLLRAGAVAFSDDGRPVSSSQMMRRALEYARVFDRAIISHAEEPTLSGNGSMHEGSVSARLGLRGIPAEAEEIMVYRDLALARLTSARLHIAHVSTAASVELIRRAKEQGISVTAETAPHYFTLTHEAVDGYNTSAKMNPPLRTAQDMEAVRGGLKDGTIDVVASDHAPHSSLEKEVEFERAAYGVVGLETILGLTLKLVNEGVLNLFQALRLLSSNPARILNVPGGCIRVGGPADLTLIDPNARYQVNVRSFLSLGRNSPFDGMTLQGRSVQTVVKGRVIRLPRRTEGDPY